MQIRLKNRSEVLLTNSGMPLSLNKISLKLGLS